MKTIKYNRELIVLFDQRGGIGVVRVTNSVREHLQTWCTGMLVPAALKPSAPAV